MSTVAEHVQRLAIFRQIMRAELKREPEHRDLMLDFEFKLDAARLCAAHLDDLLALTGQSAAEATGNPQALPAGELTEDEWREAAAEAKAGEHGTVASRAPDILGLDEQDVPPGVGGPLEGRDAG